MLNLTKSSNKLNELWLSGFESEKSSDTNLSALLASLLLLPSLKLTFADETGMGGIVNKLVKQLAALRKQIVIIGTAIAALSLTICVVIFIASKDDKKMSSAKNWGKNICGGYIVLLLVVVIISFLQSWGKGLDSSVDSGGDAWK